MADARMSEHPTTVPSTRESQPVGGAPRWGVSSRDWQSHALDAEHPEGVRVARCGQRLARDTTLYDEPPGWMCVPCLRHTDREDTATLPRMLSEMELVDWMALSGVHAGRMTRCHGEYLDAGQPMPRHLAPGCCSTRCCGRD